MLEMSEPKGRRGRSKKCLTANASSTAVALSLNGTEATGSSSRSSTERREALKIQEHQPFFTGQK
jgi:hypothetical protein